MSIDNGQQSIVILFYRPSLATYDFLLTTKKTDMNNWFECKVTYERTAEDGTAK